MSTRTGVESNLKEALQQQETRCAGGVADFACIAAYIEETPSTLESPHWSFSKSMRLAWELAVIQTRVIPRAVLPCALIVAVVALGAGCFIASDWDASGATWWFSVFLLLGVALTVTAALSTGAADALALAMPLGPQTVLLARLAVVLSIDAIAGLVASVAFIWWGVPLEFGAVVSSWLIPLAAVAGISAFVAVWANTSWMGAAAGAILVPFVVPVGYAAADGGVFAMIAQVQGVVGFGVIVVAGCVLLAITVLTTRRVQLAHLQAA